MTTPPAKASEATAGEQIVREYIDGPASDRVLIAARIDALIAERDRAKDEEVRRLREALAEWSADMHGPSTRPCETCEKATKAMGTPMGCYRYQAAMREQSRATTALKEQP